MLRFDEEDDDFSLPQPRFVRNDRDICQKLIQGASNTVCVVRVTIFRLKNKNL